MKPSFEFNSFPINNDDNQSIKEKSDLKTSRVLILLEIFSIGNLAYLAISAIIIFLRFYYANKKDTLQIVLADYIKTSDNSVMTKNLTILTSDKYKDPVGNQTYLFINSKYDFNSKSSLNITNCFLYKDKFYLLLEFASIQMLTKSSAYEIEISKYKFTLFFFNKNVQFFIAVILNVSLKILSSLISKQFSTDDKCTKFTFTFFHSVLFYFFYSSTAFGMVLLGDSYIDPCYGFKENTLLHFIFKNSVDPTTNEINQYFLNNNFLHFCFILYEYSLIINNITQLAIIVYLVILYSALLRRNYNIKNNRKSWLCVGGIQCCLVCCIFWIFFIPYIFFSLFGFTIFIMKMGRIFRIIKKFTNYILDLIDVLSFFATIICLILSILPKFNKLTSQQKKTKVDEELLQN